MEAVLNYEKAPTSENREIYLKEREKTQHEIMVTKTWGILLTVGKQVLIGWVVRGANNK